GLARALLFLVLILPEIHDAADRRSGRRRDLDEVESLLLGDGQGLRRRHDAELLAGVIDHPDFADPDPFVDPHAIVAAGTARECDKASYVKTTTPRPPCRSRDLWTRSRRAPMR